jgi:hypothetical protein
MSMTERYALASDLVRILAFLTDLEIWNQLPWYQRLLTPKPKYPEFVK